MSYEQQRQALILANRVRCERAGLKHNLRMLPSQEIARHRAAEIIEDPPRCADGMEVGDLLKSCRQLGPRYSQRYLDAAGVDWSCPIGSLSDYERGALCAMLRLGIASPQHERADRYRQRKAAA